MLEEYDVDKLNPRPNPYAKELNTSNENAIHELYERCMTINFDKTHILLEKPKQKKRNSSEDL